MAATVGQIDGYAHVPREVSRDNGIVIGHISGPSPTAIALRSPSSPCGCGSGVSLHRYRSCGWLCAPELAGPGLRRVTVLVVHVVFVLFVAACVVCARCWEPERYVARVACGRVSELVAHTGRVVSQDAVTANHGSTDDLAIQILVVEVQGRRLVFLAQQQGRRVLPQVHIVGAPGQTGP